MVSDFIFLLITLTLQFLATFSSYTHTSQFGDYFNQPVDKLSPLTLHLEINSIKLPPTLLTTGQFFIKPVDKLPLIHLTTGYYFTQK
jgi:hypothetical protein